MKIAVVGNSPVIKNKERGVTIDSADLVIRMNRFKLEPDLNKYTGVKTDIVSLRATGVGISQELIEFVDSDSIKNCSEIWIPILSEFYHQETENRFFNERQDADIKKLKFATFREYGIILENCRNHWHFDIDTKIKALEENFLTTGFLTLMLACQRYPGAEILIAGFDPGQTQTYTHYWLPENLPQHDFLELENKIIKYCKKIGQIRDLSLE